MQFSTIFVAAFAAMAAAAPTDSKSGSNGSSGSTSCPAGQKAQCCSSMQKSVLGLIPVQIGIGCVDILGGSCNQQTACCSSTNNGIQLVNVCQVL